MKRSGERYLMDAIVPGGVRAAISPQVRRTHG